MARVQSSINRMFKRILFSCQKFCFKGENNYLSSYRTQKSFNLIIQKWIPLFNKFKVDIPLSCPLHPERDIYHVIHQSKFQVDPRKWSCSLCGKSFHREPFLDLHMLKKHQDKLQLVNKIRCRL